MECHFDSRQVLEMPWRHTVKLTLAFDKMAAERKEQADKVSRERALAANGGMSRF